MHSALPACPQPLLVRNLQLVEVRPYAKEEEDVVNSTCMLMPKIAAMGKFN